MSASLSDPLAAPSAARRHPCSPRFSSGSVSCSDRHKLGGGRKAFSLAKGSIVARLTLKGMLFPLLAMGPEQGLFRYTSLTYPPSPPLPSLPFFPSASAPPSPPPLPRH